MNAPVSARTVTLRCSSLPLALGCPGAIELPDVQIREDAPAADSGTAGHELLARLVDTGVVPWDDVPAVAAKHLADPEEVRMLLACGQKLWREVEDSFVNARSELFGEIEIGPLILTGHMDLAALSTSAARCGDWKTGRKDSSYVHQLRGYAAILFGLWPELEEVTSTALWVRYQEIENYTISRRQNDAWTNELVERVLHWDGVFHPGDRCLYCPRAHECPGRAAVIRRDVSAFEATSFDFSLMSPDQIVDLVERASVVAQLAERVRDCVKQQVQACGEIVASDGRRLTVIDTPRRAVDPLAAWPVLEGLGFEDADFAACVKISMGELEKRVASRAPKRGGAAAKRDLEEKLRAADALRTTTSPTLVTRRS